VWISEQTAIISLYNINWLVCITETECVYCAVRTGYLAAIHWTLKTTTPQDAAADIHQQDAPKSFHSAISSTLISKYSNVRRYGELCLGDPRIENILWSGSTGLMRVCKKSALVDRLRDANMHN